MQLQYYGTINTPPLRCTESKKTKSLAIVWKADQRKYNNYGIVKNSVLRSCE